MRRESFKRQGILERLNQFMWKDHDERSRLVQWLVGELRVLYFVVRGFIAHQCPLRASALTFVTLLSLIPLLGLGFAMAKGLGINTVEPIRNALSTLLAADQEEVGKRIATYTEQISFSTLQTAGIFLLILTAIAAVGTMEAVFNEIWGIRRARTLLRKFADYLSVVIVFPVLVAAAIGTTATLASSTLVERLYHIGFLNEMIESALALLPYASVWVALTFLYAFLPNTRVRLRCALAGGFAAGVIWQLAFWGYTSVQVGMTARYGAVYSTLAALPIFLSWLYLSWLIVLFGAEVAAAYQNIETYARERMVHKVSPAERLRIGLNLVLTICARFRHEEPAWTADQLSRYLQCPPHLADEILADLTTASIVMPAGDKGLPTFQPGVPLANISPARVIEALQESHTAGLAGTATPEAIYARTLMEQWREGLWRELGQIGFDVLVDELQPTSSAARSEQRDRS